MGLLVLAAPITIQAAQLPVQEAEALYRENCAVCHGDNGDGQTRARFGLDPKPRDFTDPEVAEEMTRKRMIASVTYGRKGTAMVAWEDRMSSVEIAGVVDYIRNRFMSGSDGEMLEATPQLDHGRKIYEEHCRVCHGDRGNGATWTNTVLDPAPRNFTSPQSRRLLTRKRMLASVTHGRKNTAMMSFSNRLSDYDINSVVDYIRETFMTGPVIADAGQGNPGMNSAGGGHSGGGHGAGGIGRHGMGQRAPALAQTPDADMSAPFPGGLWATLSAAVFSICVTVVFVTAYVATALVLGHRLSRPSRVTLSIRKPVAP